MNIIPKMEFCIRKLNYSFWLISFNLRSIYIIVAWTSRCTTYIPIIGSWNPLKNWRKSKFPISYRFQHSWWFFIFFQILNINARKVLNQFIAFISCWTKIIVLESIMSFYILICITNLIIGIWLNCIIQQPRSFCILLRCI